jgi:hypothetical protein
MKQFDQWDFLQSLEPGTKIVTYRKREQWVKLRELDDDPDLWASTETGAVRHFSWLVDEIFPPELVHTVLNTTIEGWQADNEFGGGEL